MHFESDVGCVKGAELAPHTILVHGLARSRFDMVLLSRRLRRLVPQTTIHLFDYQSRRFPLGELARQLSDFVTTVTAGEPVSFVGHSLGGVLVRVMDHHVVPAAPLKRLVTLGSPHGGASIARFLNRSGICRALLGPVLGELATLSIDAEPQQLEIGSLVGGTGSSWGFFPPFGEDNDGVVLVREALQVSSVDTCTLPIHHAYMPFSSTIANLSAQFLAHGSFAKQR